MNEIMLHGSECLKANIEYTGMPCEFSAGAICVKG